MKVRESYVSNSSSSSFIIKKEGLTEEQIDEIRKYLEIINYLGSNCYYSEYDKRDPSLEDEEDFCFEPADCFDVTIDNSLYDHELERFFKDKFGIKVEDW